MSPAPRTRALAASIRSFAAALAAVVGAGWLASGSCSVSLCHEDCDPCVESCKCHRVCAQGAEWQRAHRLEHYQLLAFSDGEGRESLVYASVVGVSLARLQAPPYARADLVRFARGVLAFNPELFPAADGQPWRLASAEVFEQAGVVIFHQECPTASGDVRPSHSLSLLFGPAGDLLEVDHTRAAGP